MNQMTISEYHPGYIFKSSENILSKINGGSSDNYIQRDDLNGIKWMKKNIRKLKKKTSEHTHYRLLEGRGPLEQSLREPKFVDL